MGLPPTKRSVTGFFAYGAHIKIDETYCDDVVAARLISPPSIPPDALMRSGRLPCFSMYSIVASFSRSASTSAPIGRCFIRLLPVRPEWSCSEAVTRVATVVKNLEAVPAFPR